MLQGPFRMYVYDTVAVRFQLDFYFILRKEKVLRLVPYEPALNYECRVKPLLVAVAYPSLVICQRI